ncbi:MAG: hypothetical protein JWM80_2297, partial [Cyanobacteria bacterium RYN_339]|nr:hypothetical protein [Cyanobacteria bacterium RYN_339]
MRRLLPLLLLAGCAQDVACPAGQLNVGVIVGGVAIAPIAQVHPGATDAITQEVPLEAADVYLADAAGQALPGLHYSTDANGRFDVRRAPPDAAVQVVAKQGAISQRALAQPSSQGANVDVNEGTT